MSAEISFDLSKLLSGVSEFEIRFAAAVQKFASTAAKQLETYAKQNARWKDRTGDARRRMKGDSEAVAGGYKLSLAHGVNYGIWLELAMERRYAIIEETIDKVGKGEIFPAFEGFMDRMRGS